LRSDETPHRTASDPKILGVGIDQTPQRTGDTLSQRGYGPTTLSPPCTVEAWNTQHSSYRIPDPQTSKTTGRTPGLPVVRKGRGDPRLILGGPVWSFWGIIGSGAVRCGPLRCFVGCLKLQESQPRFSSPLSATVT